MNYPLDLKFKLLAINTQISVNDASGATVMYVKQKAFKLKEDITVFSDDSQSRPLYNIKADRIIDFSARYNFTDTYNAALGAVKREGMRSFWKATYNILDGETVVMTVTEANPWIKVADAVLEEVPLVGLVSGYLFNPAYDVKRPDGTTVLRLQKVRSLAERRFRVERLTPMNEIEELRAILGLLMVVLLEKSRG